MTSCSDGRISTIWPGYQYAKKRQRNPHIDPFNGSFIIAAIGPESGAIVGVERCAGRKLIQPSGKMRLSLAIPSLRYSNPNRAQSLALANMYTELMNVPVGEFECHVLHAEWVENSLPREFQRPLGERRLDAFANDS